MYSCDFCVSFSWSLLLTSNLPCFRARPCSKVTKLQSMTDVTSGRGAVPPSTSQTTSTRTAPSTPASVGVTNTATSPVPESQPRSRVETPPVIQSSSGTGTYTTVTQAPSAPQKATPVIQLNDEPTRSSVNYSRLRISDNKSFS